MVIVLEVPCGGEGWYDRAGSSTLPRPAVIAISVIKAARARAATATPTVASTATTTTAAALAMAIVVAVVVAVAVAMAPHVTARRALPAWIHGAGWLISWKAMRKRK